MRSDELSISISSVAGIGHSIFEAGTSGETGKTGKRNGIATETQKAQKTACF